MFLDNKQIKDGKGFLLTKDDNTKKSQPKLIGLSLLGGVVGGIAAVLIVEQVMKKPVLTRR